MKKAGLSVGMMYGKGGGAQPTLGTGSASVNAPTAMPQNMAMDMATQAANIELAKAQAEKAKAEAKKIGGVDTEEGYTRIKSLTQGMNESRAKTRLLEFQGDSEEYNVNLKHDTYEDLVNQTKLATKNAIQGLRILQNSADYNEATYNDRVNIITAELLGQELSNKVLELNQDKTKEEIEQIKQNIEASKATITQGWTKLSLEAKQQAINWFNAAVNQRWKGCD